MKRLTLTLIAALLIAFGCGGEETSTTGAQQSPDVTTSRDSGQATTDAGDGDGAATETRHGDVTTPERKGTRITIRDSEFGEMLFDSRRQAIYVFENDRKRRTVCYGECAVAWPPVLTEGEPVAGRGVDADLLGTIRRRGGARQLTYAGRPLYYYANEERGEVRCHNVNLNGGLWWVVGPDGKRRP
jgi:predicted lipoprotein with Yx(FWY)xxD motif